MAFNTGRAPGKRYTSWGGSYDDLANDKETAALLFSEYICLAIMSFPYSYSVLGLVPGLILTAVTASFVLYTSLVVWYVVLSLLMR